MKLPHWLRTWLLAQREAEQRAPFVPHLSRVPDHNDVERIGSWDCCPRCCYISCSAIHREPCRHQGDVA